MKKLVCAIALGVALGYLFDPELGARRREELRHRLDRSRGSSAPTPVDVLIFDDRVPVAAGLS